MDKGENAKAEQLAVPGTNAGSTSPNSTTSTQLISSSQQQLSTSDSDSPNSIISQSSIANAIKGCVSSWLAGREYNTGTDALSLLGFTIEAIA